MAVEVRENRESPAVRAGIVLSLALGFTAAAGLIVVAERCFHRPTFDPAHGGDPLMFQHLFWFSSHPADYIMLLPGRGW